MMFMNNSITGIFVFAAIFAFKLELVGYGALGLFVTTVTALILGVKRGLIRAGLFGFPNYALI